MKLCLSEILPGPGEDRLLTKVMLCAKWALHVEEGISHVFQWNQERLHQRAPVWSNFEG